MATDDWAQTERRRRRNGRIALAAGFGAALCGAVGVWSLAYGRGEALGLLVLAAGLLVGALAFALDDGEGGGDALILPPPI